MCLASRERTAVRRPSRSPSSSPPSPSCSSGDGAGSAAAVPPSQILSGLDRSYLGSSRPVGFVSESGTHRHYDKATAMRWRNLKWTAPLVPEVMGTAELDRPTALVT